MPPRRSSPNFGVFDSLPGQKAHRQTLSVVRKSAMSGRAVEPAFLEATESALSFRRKV